MLYLFHRCGISNKYLEGRVFPHRTPLWVFKMIQISKHVCRKQKNAKTLGTLMYILSICDDHGALSMTTRRLGEVCGVSKSEIHRILTALHEARLIELRSGSIIKVLNYDNYTLYKTKLDDNAKKIDQVIKYFDEVTGKKTNTQNKKIRKLINNIIYSGYSFEQIKTVIKRKNDQWKNDEVFSKYVRPSTLFGSKFDEYLNEKVESRKELKKEDYPFLSDEEFNNLKQNAK